MRDFATLSTTALLLCALAVPTQARTTGGAPPQPMKTTSTASAKPKLDKNGNIYKPPCKPPVLYGSSCRHVPRSPPR